MIASGSTFLGIQSDEEEVPDRYDSWRCRRWLSGVPCSDISTNRSAAQAPFQRWYRVKEAFSPRLVAAIIGTCGTSPKTCLDPFGGSGTTALTCQFLGVRPTTIEVNPFLADLIRAKLSRYDREDLLTSYRHVLSEGRGSPKGYPPTEGPPTLCEPGVNGRWIFSKRVFARIAALNEAIQHLPNDAHRSLFRALLGSITVPVSNVIISGKGRRYRAPRYHDRADDVDGLFRTAFERAFTDICAYGNKATNDFTLLIGDSRVEIHNVDKVDVAISSPPYPNSFDYSDIYNVELWALGYLKSAAANRSLRNATLRSHVQITRDFGYRDLGSKTLKRTISELDRRRATLWNRYIPEMIGAYFDDLADVLKGMADKLKRGGTIVLAVGDSRYAGVVVNVENILREIAPSVGLQMKRHYTLRSMRDSAQQGGQFRLNESLLFFSF
ncbi:MAG TPA: hypothetical protein VGW57_15440 [Chthoniobacterales bacterium]|nr:hypothetical protein [Chthoniobacterales bacterium]